MNCYRSLQEPRPRMNDLAPSTSYDAIRSEVEHALIDQQFPIFRTGHGPALWPVADPFVGPPAIVLSVPKSGTYFTEALYKRMGYQAVRVHAMDMYCNDWRFEEVTSLKNIPITILSRLVLPGQVILSHCGRDPSIVAALRSFKKIYLYRDLRETFVSHTRQEQG